MRKISIIYILNILFNPVIICQSVTYTYQLKCNNSISVKDSTGVFNFQIPINSSTTQYYIKNDEYTLIKFKLDSTANPTGVHLRFSIDSIILQNGTGIYAGFGDSITFHTLPVYKIKSSQRINDSIIRHYIKRTDLYIDVNKHIPVEITPFMMIRGLKYGITGYANSKCTCEYIDHNSRDENSLMNYAQIFTGLDRKKIPKTEAIQTKKKKVGNGFTIEW